MKAREMKQVRGMGSVEPFWPMETFIRDITKMEKDMER